MGSVSELLIILVIVLILFGANRLPDSRSLGSGVKEFKKGVNEVKAEDTTAAAKKPEENKT